MKGEKAYTSACDCPGTCSYCRTDNTSGNAWHGAIPYLLSEQISKTESIPPKPHASDHLNLNSLKFLIKTSQPLKTDF